MKKYGLIGKNIDYSFSKKYFTKKFKSENIEASYENFDIKNITEFLQIIKQEKKLVGLNVTTPYKVEILPYLDQIDKQAEIIGAVNTIKINNAKLIGYNTDAFGFVKSIFTRIENHHEKALVLGSGGASKAIVKGLKSMSIDAKIVSREPQKGAINYSDLSEELMNEYFLIINCTPVGTYPYESNCPDIPYKFLTQKHFLYDLVYNPPMTKFLALGNQQGAKIINGSKMLTYQAERAWQIWNE
ncbi:MAG: shikimate dehydrogenase [Psychroflexus maritimus]